MPFNPSPKVADAREIARKWGADKVVILFVTETPEETRLEYASYGKTESKCREARRIADKAYDAVMDYLTEGGD